MVMILGVGNTAMCGHESSMRINPVFDKSAEMG
jgi:hypothetical protein